MTPEQIASHVTKTELVPKLKQFKDRAAETLSALKVVEPIKNAVVKSLLQDETLKQRVVSLLPSQEGFDPQAAAEEALRIVIDKIRETLRVCPISGFMVHYDNGTRHSFLWVQAG